ncbi:tRNA (adenosine(37)-N6)-threonylcarbamoyltransferase complex transferase subunit TsaD [Mycoplasmopsis bovis]|uniref:tRNA (adenosine(37)-N6)-threonylcarbamoyltransferase complex transferase subunit TsaD n=1 Tax=Mycoplasmopsis bovis TaxID=28903 RepID=UPI000E10B95D|nr:tRNA (adenosine(37)-N6)-threonylcarbamoyltransferase complex transferase subunit TsaD [Mycoplasmopsis bovis]AXJ68471.1 tRNA (adenosine(37)-N6)-threonylcarbamoyltransferase complex transferase subunit TsaD [Mycoplasmopsis bovis]AXJ74141.1 tRNA (adenosine(37)-N6)-threonylcarbamoyltransferase complex transferase subunit TsaD [Mycoplasmopsis bovis]MBT1322970.1 tRNA (adenosine(37)-N6)-threonylcarbamoyltransferase complex transferase subunit TsaD [Mycoplasmopsis bovis]MBT1363583.1 tRNA (adenosine(
MKILGIETSHDDTSIAILEDNKVIALETISQVDIFKEFGGTIPEISSREHVKNINLILEILLKKYDLSTIDYIAYTKEPGLVGTLQIGYLFASAVSLAYNKPIIPINHLIGHFYSCALDNEIKYPSLCLLVSGGHTQLMLINSPIDYEIIGQTLDDAVGEAFDKVSSKLQLGFPGGPIIDKIYKNYKGEFIKFTEPNAPGEFNFSFSGLKSQVINYYHNKLQRNEKVDVDQIAASFQDCAVNYLINQTKKALLKYDVKSLVLAGGVSANSELRKRFLEISQMAIIPNLRYATDNGAMIASCAYQILKEK